jgi:hypothetical protein
MLADPQSVTIAGAATSLPRTGVGSTYAEYTSADGAVSLRVQQITSKAQRRTVVSLKSNKIAADPITAVNRRLSSVISVSITDPVDGFTATELKDQLVALATALTASSAALTLKVLGGEK